jgi:hypothetical protein
VTPPPRDLSVVNVGLLQRHARYYCRSRVPRSATVHRGDDLTCRLATTTESFIVTQPGPPFGGAAFPISVTSDCMLTWDTTGASAGSLWAAQVIIEESNGVESAFLEAEWRQTSSGWLLRLSDLN